MPPAPTTLETTPATTPASTASAAKTTSTARTPLVTPHGVTLRGYGRTFPGAGGGGRTHTVLRDVDLDVAPGELVAVLGPSGCGKSTLLRAAGGLDAASTGQVLLDGSPVRAFDGRCAVAFQEPRLLPWRTLAANVSLGLPRGTPRGAGHERVEHLLGLVGLSDFAGHRPRSVSGGMAQRASLARALAREPGVLLLDEPFGALDALTRLRMQDLLLDVLRVRPTTVLLVTHDVDEALHLGDRVVVLGAAPGAGELSAGELSAGELSAGELSAGELSAGEPGSTVTSVVTVPGARPRERGDAGLARLRADLLAQLGVHR